MGDFPQNFHLLKTAEDDLRGQSIKLVESDPDLSLHAEMIERVMDTLQFYRINHDEKSQEQTAIKLLGARLFNSMAAGMNLTLSGYYQAATTHVRDILETTFLLDYFTTDLKLVARWSQISEQDRTREFGQFKIRTALDERDGYTTRKRHEHYKLLCNLASHPTFEGLELLRPAPGELAMMGPFLSPSLLRAVVEELVKVCMLASDVFVAFFPAQTLEQMFASVARIEASAAWFKRVFGVDKSKEIAEMKATAEAIAAITNGGR
ncbi:hypothetical protein B9J07_25680 [Sinorhizobium sp. LM21]|nr:hypothetical protein phi3LM21_p59 [Sinorhizobium phage phi3LM21]OWZ90947.1 hypothetical protein B9J07_25680 [Sinorhizobium sp. LM21]